MVSEKEMKKEKNVGLERELLNVEELRLSTRHCIDVVPNY